MQETTTLTPPESARLTELEKIIKAGQQTFFEVGMALAEIRAAKLYRMAYNTFEDYCREAWGWSSRYVRYVVTSAETVSQMQESGTMVPLLTERAARQLSAVPAANRPAVLAAAGEQPTARSINAAAVEVLSPPAKRKYTKRNLPTTPPAGSANARSAATPPAADSSPSKFVSDELASQQLASDNFFAIQFEEIASAAIDDGTDEQLASAIKAAQIAVKTMLSEQKGRGAK
jgi:hypothetical protein